jgi:hypothetical protein
MLELILQKQLVKVRLGCDGDLNAVIHVGFHKSPEIFVKKDHAH